MSNMPPLRPFRPMRDPQMELVGTLKQSERTDMVVFSFRLLMVEVTAVVVVPAEGTTEAPVYLKFRIKQ